MNNTTDTPETDEAERKHYWEGDFFGEETTHEAYEHARKLERERDEARRLATDAYWGAFDLPWETNKPL
jgi:hypothetical protein